MVVCTVYCILRNVTSASPVDVDRILFSTSSVYASRVALKMKRLDTIETSFDGAELRVYVCVWRVVSATALFRLNELCIVCIGCFTRIC